MTAGSHELGNIHKYVTHVVTLIPFLGIALTKTEHIQTHPMTGLCLIYWNF